MRALQDNFRLKVAEAVAGVIDQSFNQSISADELTHDLAKVPNPKMGHLAFPCFKLAKTLKKNPKEIADQLAQSLQSSDKASLFADIKVAGPYLNFFMSPQAFGDLILQPMASGEYFKIPTENSPPYLIEYSQPNTHKELHVGHMRNLCYGLSLVLLYKYCGNNVVACTFPGDVGTHVAKCLWYLKYHNQEPLPTTDKGEWLGRMYTLAHNKLEDEIGSDKEEANRQQLTEILKQLEKGEGEFYDLWKETREWSIELMNRVYDWAGVSFDRWFWESEVDSPSVKLAKKLYDEGKLEESEGAIGLNLEDENLGFALFLKSDGNGLYATKDLELARVKFDEYNPALNIVVVDIRQELHFKQVFTSFGKLGLGDPERCMHLKYNFVELPDGAMSSRKGNIIPITELIEKMKHAVKEDHLNRYQGEWSNQEIDDTANVVAQGAIKYGMNKMDPNKKIVFDMHEWLRLDGESGPFIQYSHARICSLIEKIGQPNFKNCDWSLLTEPSEVALMIHLSEFQIAMFRALQGFKTSGICTYAYDLAKAFNSFYQACPIGKAPSEELKNARLCLAAATRAALEQSLGLLGIPAPQKM